MSPTSEIRLSLPWPDRALSPNGRPSHWGVEHRAKAKAFALAHRTTLAALGTSRKPGWAAAAIHWEFHPKTANKVDDDNAEGSCKAYRDGIADALGMDDANFIATRSFGEPVKGGCVHVTISQIETEAERFARMEPALFAGMRAPKRSAE